MAAYDLYILLQGNIQTKISGVTAESKEDVEVYDGTNYRDIFTVPGVKSTAANIYEPSLDGRELVATTSPVSTKTTDSAITQVAAPADGEFYSDEVMHYAPRNELKKRTRYTWTCDDGAIRWAWQEEIIMTSKFPFGFVGSSIPAPTT